MGRLRRATRPALAGALIALLAACQTTPTSPPSPPGTFSRLPPGNSSRDGPEANPPPNLEAIPDAVPQIEPLRIGGPNKPYAIDGHTYTPLTDDRPVIETGLASWYGKKFHGHRTASGEAYNMYAMTAAHKTLPIPSYARVRNPANGHEVIVRVNDRGPFSPGRVIDLSYTAALKLGVLGGVQPVEITRITADDIRTGAAFKHDPSYASAPPQPANGAVVAPPVAVAAARTLPPASTDVIAAPVQAVPANPDARAAGAPLAPIDLGSAAAADKAAPAPASGAARAMTFDTAPVSKQAAANSPPASRSTNAFDATSTSTPASASTLNPTAVPLPPLPSSASGTEGVTAVASTFPAPAAATTPIRPEPRDERARAETTAGIGYWIQLGAFRQRDGALDFQHRLIDEQPWLAPLLAVVSDHGLNKLQAGPYPSRDDAKSAAERIRVALQLVPTIVEKR